ncbi:hypothetical protein NBRC10512_003179 [Rhodotorula toruloides]|uniref:RHTO0S05e08592g1_1 n=2 Tax=Rhodotorula toruloides TaxID=5286 RepID=A0A061ATJ7_RHOTO|nr:MFS transporter [Rhodotorula toruloides NP11]EMS23771.1 MFS transporter [Rhodotorula toruloides NP11]CDR40907.1 RHTO0S05e08592g1_1 [Rhodotorula toruloides]
MATNHSARPVDFAPGTVRLLDFDDAAPGDAELVLVPAPSSHPDDPLNWFGPRKWLSLACVVLYTFSSGALTAALYSIYPDYSAATGIDIPTLNQAVGVMFLLVGFGPMLTTPLSNIIGKRPIYLGSLLLSGSISIWSVFIKSTPQWYGRCVLLGIAGGPVFATTEVSVSDVFFAHERALPMGIYIIALYLGALAAPLIGAYLAAAWDYRAVFYFCAILIYGTLAFCFVFMEETNYVRPSPLETTSAGDDSDDDHKHVDPHKISASSHVVQVDAKRKSFVKRMALFERPGPHAWKIFKVGILQPIAFLRLPIVWWCAVMYAFGQVWFNLMNALTASILMAPPYNFSVKQVGLAYLSPMILTIPSVILYGWVNDKWALWMAKRRGGISEPEDKLSLLLLTTAIPLPVSLLMLGLPPTYAWRWPAYVVAGMGMSVMFGSFLTASSIYYLFDCYHTFRPYSYDLPTSDSPQILALLMPSMAISFGFNYAVSPWTAGIGLRNFGISACFTAFGCALLTLPMLRWGKALRIRDAAMYYGEGGSKA